MNNFFILPINDIALTPFSLDILSICFTNILSLPRLTVPGGRPTSTPVPLIHPTPPTIRNGKVKLQKTSFSVETADNIKQLS